MVKEERDRIWGLLVAQFLLNVLAWAFLFVYIEFRLGDLKSWVLIDARRTVEEMVADEIGVEAERKTTEEKENGNTEQ